MFAVRSSDQELCLMGKGWGDVGAFDRPGSEGPGFAFSPPYAHSRSASALCVGPDPGPHASIYLCGSDGGASHHTASWDGGDTRPGLTDEGWPYLLTQVQQQHHYPAAASPPHHLHHPVPVSMPTPTSLSSLFRLSDLGDRAPPTLSCLENLLLDGLSPAKLHGHPLNDPASVSIACPVPPARSHAGVTTGATGVLAAALPVSSAAVATSSASLILRLGTSPPWEDSQDLAIPPGAVDGDVDVGQHVYPGSTPLATVHPAAPHLEATEALARQYQLERPAAPEAHAAPVPARASSRAGGVRGSRSAAAKSRAAARGRDDDWYPRGGSTRARQGTGRKRRQAATAAAAAAAAAAADEASPPRPPPSKPGRGRRCSGSGRKRQSGGSQEEVDVTRMMNRLAARRQRQNAKRRQARAARKRERVIQHNGQLKTEKGELEEKLRLLKLAVRAKLRAAQHLGNI